MPEIKNYDPGLITLSALGIPIQGWMSGTFVTVERAVDSFSLDVGADGAGTFIRSRNKSGTIVFILKAESSVNDLLSAKIVEDEASGTAFGPALLKNLNGTTIVRSTRARLTRPANIEFADEQSGREWTLLCADMSPFVGGAVV